MATLGELARAKKRRGATLGELMLASPNDELARVLTPLLLGGQSPETVERGSMVRPDLGLGEAQIQPAAKSPYEATLAPGETRSPEELRQMLGEVILAAGSGVLPEIGPRGQAKKTPGRVRPGFEKQFKDWYSESKVGTEPSGQPKTLYHGSSTSGFTAFSKEKASPGLYGRGFYFTSDPGIASEYATIKGDQSASGVIPAHVMIKKPFNMEEFIPAHDVRKIVESIWRQRDLDPMSKVEGHLRLTKKGKQLIGQGEEGNLDGKNFYYALDSMTYGHKDQITQALKDAGFDGIKHQGGQVIGNRPHDVWIAFEPSQIKSATGSSGTYNQMKEDIRE